MSAPVPSSSGAVDPAERNLGPDEPKVAARLRSWQEGTVMARILRQDPTLWPEASSSDVRTRLGWLELPESMTSQLPKIGSFAEEIRLEGMRHVVVLGMGGSSLAPDVLRAVFGSAPGYPELLVLDSTHPAAVAELAARLDPARTLFLVSSKSGTTTEPLAFYHYFRDLVRNGGSDPRAHFAAITDPGTPLQRLAEEEGFRAVFLADPNVGGRYSALTMFGLVPAALLGVNVSDLLDRARIMADRCAPSVEAGRNPGLGLGAVLGELAVAGRDKLTFYAAPPVGAFPIWVEQLVAESTGKIGKGIVPIVDEPRASADRYGPDRLVVAFQGPGPDDPDLAQHLDALQAAGQPVVRVRLHELIDLGQEFFRWELAVASAGMIVGIDPFDQPDVELAKELARRAMSAANGAPAPGEVGRTAPASAPSAAAPLRAWLEASRGGEYLAIQAYLPPRRETQEAVQRLRRSLLDRWKIATTFGYGPRFLHSTGQLHKGGPNSGLFLQLVDDPSPDVEVPGAGYSFGELIRAQALGDLQALQQKGRRVVRLELGRDVVGGLRALNGALCD